jgi:hypothetical protein
MKTAGPPPLELSNTPIDLPWQVPVETGLTVGMPDPISTEYERTASSCR